MATLKRLGCSFSREEHSRGAALPTHPVQVLGNLTVLKEPGTGRTNGALEGWEELSLPLALPAPTHSQSSQTDTQQAAGGEGTGEVLPARTAKHPRDKPLPHASLTCS